MLPGRVHVVGFDSVGPRRLPGGPPALVGPRSRAGGLQLEGPGKCVACVINLLTQGSAGTLCDEVLAFCQPTNPLTRPEHALLTPPAARPY